MGSCPAPTCEKSRGCIPAQVGKPQKETGGAGPVKIKKCQHVHVKSVPRKGGSGPGAIRTCGHIRMKGLVDGARGIDGLKGMDLGMMGSAAEVRKRWSRLQEMHDEMRRSPYYIPEEHQESDEETFVPTTKHRKPSDREETKREEGEHKSHSSQQEGNKSSPCAHTRQNSVAASNHRCQVARSNRDQPQSVATCNEQYKARFHKNTDYYRSVERKLKCATNCGKREERCCRSSERSSGFVPCSALREQIMMEDGSCEDVQRYFYLKFKEIEKTKKELQEQIQEELLRQQKELDKIETRKKIRMVKKLQEQLKQMRDEKRRRREKKRMDTQRWIEKENFKIKTLYLRHDDVRDNMDASEMSDYSDQFGDNFEMRLKSYDVTNEVKHKRDRQIYKETEV